jgi:hypothetical protein
MLAALLANGVRTIIVESPDRFARDLMVQFAGHDLLIAASAPTFFLEDTPTAVLAKRFCLSAIQPGISSPRRLAPWSLSSCASAACAAQASDPLRREAPSHASSCVRSSSPGGN